jgi:uncharacterized protein YndB with AHSA1/START domain
MGTLRIEVSVRAPLDEIWRAWTTSESIARWFSPAANVEARQGGPFELFFDPSDHDHMSTKGCVFTSVEPKRRLDFNWKGPDQYAELMNGSPLTSVTARFEEEDGSTRVIVEHTGWGDGQEWAEARAWHKRAWEDVLKSLKSTQEAN